MEKRCCVWKCSLNNQHEVYFARFSDVKQQTKLHSSVFRFQAKKCASKIHVPFLFLWVYTKTQDVLKCVHVAWHSNIENKDKFDVSPFLVTWMPPRFSAPRSGYPQPGLVNRGGGFWAHFTVYFYGLRYITAVLFALQPPARQTRIRQKYAKFSRPSWHQPFI